MNNQTPSQPSAKASTKSAVMRPRDAATLIIVRHDDDKPRFMMGKRHENSAFMPGKFVFPGGRVDRGDCRVKPASELHPSVEKALINKMRGTASTLRARGLAMAAIRETFEEVGLIVGKPHEGSFKTTSTNWKPFADTGFSPSLKNLRFLARAITPPGRTRRFDARFLVADASEVANLDSPVKIDSDELLECHWVSFETAKDLNLPYITQQVLKMLAEALENKDGLSPDRPARFQHMQRGNWCYETV